MDADVALPGTSSPAASAGYLEGLRPPDLRGWPALQAWLVHHAKRASLRQLHASVAGERFLLRLYLAGEESSQTELQQEMRTDAPDWLARQLDLHLADEQMHARLFTEALIARDGSRRAAPDRSADPDRLSRRKLARWQALMRGHAPHFGAGAFVPAYAVGLVAEQTAVRVLRRHCDLIGPGHPLHPLLSRVLSDEERHVRLCSHTLQRCVSPHEHARLVQLLAKVRANERRFGITGALGMWIAGVALRLRHRAR